MVQKETACSLVLSALLAAAPLPADDVTGADRLLCAAAQATECFADGSCLPGSPEDWNVPRFLHLDLEKQELSTTKASGEERSTAMQSLRREGDRIMIQGAQTGRAFSIVINEGTGLASVGIALDGHVLNVFAYCTPWQSSDSPQP